MDYIGGTSTQLDFNEFGTEGDIKRSSVYSSTVATLTTNSMENMERILVSQLRITVRSDITPTSVVCIHNNGSMAEIVLNLLGMLHATCKYIYHIMENFQGRKHSRFSFF